VLIAFHINHNLSSNQIYQLLVGVVMVGKDRSFFQNMFCEHYAGTMGQYPASDAIDRLGGFSKFVVDDHRDTPGLKF
jgi:hypothetical protein